MRTYADVCGRMWTYADVCDTYADVCDTYVDVCDTSLLALTDRLARQSNS